ncbi:toll-like receptor 3 [Channa argus]|uniref:toll-like receptor 3 n=1 Tax=Channa argus TaxID=215402 RepID=UPI0035212608
MGNESLHLVERRHVLLTVLLLHFNPLMAYSLKNCTMDYSENPLADVFVDCSNRDLVTVPDDIPRGVSSRTLSNNLLNKINREDFGNLSNLRILDLHSNLISHVNDESFIHLGTLTLLDMAFNKLTNLTANLFQGLSNLTRLDLTGNNIWFIQSSAFRFLTSLQTVILDENKLQQITDIQPILQLPHLQELSIVENQFVSFESKDLLMNMSSSLRVLAVSGSNFYHM